MVKFSIFASELGVKKNFESHHHKKNYLVWTHLIGQRIIDTFNKRWVCRFTSDRMVKEKWTTRVQEFDDHPQITTNISSSSSHSSSSLQCISFSDIFIPKTIELTKKIKIRHVYHLFMF